MVDRILTWKFVDVVISCTGSFIAIFVDDSRDQMFLEGGRLLHGLAKIP